MKWSGLGVVTVMTVVAACLVGGVPAQGEAKGAADRAPAATGAVKPGSPPPIRVRVDPRVELLALVFRLAGHREYTMSVADSPYGRAVDKHFGPHRDHPVVLAARTLLRRRGVSYDAVMSMALHLRDTVKLEERVPFDKSPPRLDRRWGGAAARDFVAKLRDFVGKTGFNAFYAKRADLYAKAEARMRRLLAKRPYVAWFQGFFAGKAGATFILTPGLLLGGHNYGVGVRFPDGKEEIHPCIGVHKWDKEGVPLFPDYLAGTIAHELCHSYTNPIVDRHAKSLEVAGRKLFGTCESRMRKMAYGHWKTVLYESLVRAVVIRFQQDTAGKLAALKETRQQISRGFAWVPALAQELSAYQADRKRWPTLDAFMPKVVAFFERWVAKGAKAAASAKPGAKALPRVVSITPARGATHVPPGATEIRITFDRPMEPARYSVMKVRLPFPQVTGRPRWEKGGTVFVLPVRLAPATTYGFSLNGPGNPGFCARGGRPLEPVGVTFTTWR